MKRRLLLVLLAACFGGAAWLLLRPKPAPPPVRLHPTAPQVAQAEQHLTALGQVLSAAPETPAAAPATLPPGKPRTLRLSEADLNTYLAGSAAVKKQLAGRGVEAVQIVFQEPSGLTIHAAVRVKGRLQNIEIDGTLAPDPKAALRFTATSAKVGRFPLPPAAVTKQANSLAAQFTARLLHRLSLSVQSVSVEKSTLIIVAVPLKPASPQSMSPAHR